MGKADSKRDFITQLFLYYKPLLSREKQIQLLTSWIDSCAGMEEYEMASTLKKELLDIEGGLDEETTSKLAAIEIPEIRDLPMFNTKKELVQILPPKEKPKNKKNLTWITPWGEPRGFIIINLEFSIIKRRFKIVFFNYGFKTNGR